MQKVFIYNSRLYMKMSLNFKQLNNTEELKYKPVKR